MFPRTRREPKPLARIAGVVSISLSLTASFPCLADPCAWRLRSTSGPSPRQGSAIAYDRARRVTVLFGGYENGAGYQGDTWEWNGTTWALRSSGGPSPRYWHAMTYDDARRVTVLFGGSDASGSPVGDTWEWDGGVWSLRNGGGPSARLNHSISYDSARGVVVLHGGYDGLFVLGQTWEWDGDAWALRSQSGPSPRGAHAATYDSVRGVTTLFGGINGSTGFVGDTWDWDGTAWTLRSNGGPAARAGHAMAYDGAREATVLFGGSDGSGGPVGETWEWDGATWSLQNSIGPSPRYWHAMAFDSVRGVTVLFGGSNGSTYLGDTWEFDCRPSGPTVGNDVCDGGDNASQPCGQNSDCPGGFCRLKNRFISAVLPETTSAHGVKVSLVAMDANSVAAPGSYNGTARWVGVPSLNVDDGLSPAFNASKVQCAFSSQDWGAVGPIHMYGDVIVPKSVYEVSICSGATGPCSAPLRIGTAKYGDVVAPSDTVNFEDVNSIVAKFQGMPAGPSKTRTKLTNSIVNPGDSINFREVSACVSAFQGKPFKTVVTLAPATCP